MNAKGKVLHVCNLDKFIPPFIDFVEENFDDFATRHVFFISGNTKKNPYRARANIVQAQRGKKAQLLHLAKLATAIQKADKIILHGLFNHYVVRLLFLMPWVLKKCYWVIWGGDLYVYQLGNRNSKRWKLNEFFRRPVIKNMGNIVSGNIGDISNAVKWYNFKGGVIKSILYTSNIFRDDLLSACFAERKEEVKVLLGNSATESNRHLEALERIHLETKKVSKKVKLILPLSYGDYLYRDKICDYGKNFFGSSFHPILHFMNYEAYLSVLLDIDIVVFNHNRQQGFGNLIQLIGFGKKVYISRESSLWEYFKSIGIIVYDFKKFNFEAIEESIALNNRRIIIENFSLQRIVSDTEKIFN